jgi:hypothetical protein
MYYLGSLFPRIQSIRIPFSRDQVMLLIAAVNEIFLGIDIYLAHLISGTIVPREWIPIIFGPVAGLLLLVAGLIALRARLFASTLASLVFLSSILVGALGSFFHIIRAAQPTAPIGSILSVELLVNAPPFLAPLAFAGVALLGLVAAWVEKPAGSGQLMLGSRQIKLPFSKTRAYLILVCLGILVTLISSVLDHARSGFENPWLYLPTAVAVFATAITLYLAFQSGEFSRTDIGIYFWTMLVMFVIGLSGLNFHIQANLISEGTFVGERFLRGAPFMAPLLFCNMGMVAIAVLLDPKSEGD